MTNDEAEAMLAQVERMLRDFETRLETMLAVNQSWVNGTDPDTLEGRQARLMQKAIRQLLEDAA